MSALQVLLIGCGNIAGVFDEGQPENSLPFTHAGAYTRDGRFKVSACVEPDETRRKAFMRAWSVQTGFHYLDETMDLVGKYDIISICSPTKYHADDLGKAILLKPKLIFCEKPVTTSALETENLCLKCNKENILLAVNYTRRWDPDVVKLHNDIKAGRWGPLRSVVGTYNKGILNNGSHMIDLLHLLVGGVDIIKVGKPIHDFFPDDPTVPVWLEGPHGVPIQLVCGHAGDYAIFELQLIFSGGVVTMEDGGMSWRERKVLDSEIFKGYRVLDDGITREGDNPRAMLQAVDNIFKAIQQDALLASTGDSALAAQRVCEQIKQQAYAL